jgi:hypothetical protein
VISFSNVTKFLAVQTIILIVAVNSYGLDRGLETAHRRYGRFLHSKPNPDYEAAEEEFKKGLSQAKKKNNYLEIIENIQELIFLSAEQGKEIEFKYWNCEINKYKDKIWQWNVFPAVIKVAEGCLLFANQQYKEAVEAYIQGYISLAQQKGYGAALYETHRDRVFNNIEKLHDSENKQKWLLTNLRESWRNAGLDNRYPDFIELCDLHLLTLELF